jgi:hypothetical protein
MKSKLFVLGLVLVLSALILSACVPAEPVTVLTTDVIPEGPVDTEFAAARDAALAYLGDRYGEQSPPSDLAWSTEPIELAAPQEMGGSRGYRYTANGWVAMVTYPVRGPQRVTYRVRVASEAAGFRWEGHVDGEGYDVYGASEDLVAAREAALAYLRGQSGNQAPASGLTWMEELTTPELLPGGINYRFTAGDWAVTVDTAVVPLETRVYQVTVDNAASGYRWEGRVDATGQVTDVSDTMPVNAPDPARARDLALAYVVNKYGIDALPELTWTEENTTPGLIGGANLKYTTGEWVVTVSYPIVPPERTVYRVTVANEATGLLWEGEVGAAGDVQTTQDETTVGLPVVAWYGSVVSLPAGSQYDDYLSLLPGGAGEIGVEGASEAVEAQIVALRDKAEPGKYAHFWGTLNCPALDYGGCELVVTRLRVDGPGPFFAPDPVEGWEGTVYSGQPGLQVDDYFVFVGDFNVWYGIWSPDPTIQGQLESLRDTGTVIRVWGKVVSGVMDGNGTQIQVNRFEIVEQPSGVVPPLPEWPEADDGMLVYTNEDYGYRLKVPPSAQITEFGAVSFSPDERPKGMTDEEYMARLQEQYGDGLCVYIEYGLGYMFISAPPNQGYPGFRHTPCGLTGLGAGKIVQKTQEVTIAGQIYTARGFEWIGTLAPCSPPRETLDCHNETFVVVLEDGTRIEYGARSEPTASYQDYLVKGRDMLLQILASYEPVPISPSWESALLQSMLKAQATTVRRLVPASSTSCSAATRSAASPAVLARPSRRSCRRTG